MLNSFKKLGQPGVKIQSYIFELKKKLYKQLQDPGPGLNADCSIFWYAVQTSINKIAWY